MDPCEVRPYITPFVRAIFSSASGEWYPSPLTRKSDVEQVARLPSPRRSEINIFPILYHGVSFGSTVRGTSSNEFIYVIIFPLVVGSFLLSVYLA